MQMSSCTSLVKHNSSLLPRSLKKKKGPFCGGTLTFGDWMSGGVDMAPKRSSCSTGCRQEKKKEKKLKHAVMIPLLELGYVIECGERLT